MAVVRFRYKRGWELESLVYAEGRFSLESQERGRASREVGAWRWEMGRSLYTEFLVLLQKSAVKQRHGGA